jgi:PmbA protein
VSELALLAESLLDRAAVDEQLEVVVSRGTDTDVRAYRGEIEFLASAVSAGVGVRVLREGAGGATVGCAWAGSLETAAIAEALAEARENVRFASEDEYVALARPDGVAAASLALADDRVASTALDAKIQLAIELEQTVRGADSRIRQVQAATYSDYDADVAIASTTGIRAASRRTGAHLSVVAIAADEEASHTGWGLTAARSPAGLDPASAAADAVRRATMMLGAVKPASVKGVVVFDPRTAATLLAIVGGALSGDAVVRGRSFFADRVGESVAVDGFTLVDDPTDARHFAAAPYDGEGLASRRNVLIENGQLRGFVHDTVSARRAGTVSTAGAVRGALASSPSASCRALALAEGEFDQAELLRRVGHGVFIESLTGVHSGVNPISGDFSVGVTGRMIRDGALAEPIREATVASTLQRMLLEVVAIGADREWLPGLAAGQSLAIDGVTLSGT